MNEYHVTYEDLNTHLVETKVVNANNEDEAYRAINNDPDKVVIDIN